MASEVKEESLISDMQCLRNLAGTLVNAENQLGDEAERLMTPGASTFLGYLVRT